jgi:hypothetical protein
MSSGNPEQTILALTCLALLSTHKAFKFLLRKSLQGLFVSVTIYVSIQFWMRMNGIQSNRISVIPYFLKVSLNNFVDSPLPNVWSWLGVTWIFLVGYALTTKGIEKVTFLTASVLIPALATIITADGPRVFAFITMPLVLIVGIYFFKNCSRSDRGMNLTVGCYLLLWIVIPTSSPWGFFGDFFKDSLTAIL